MLNLLWAGMMGIGILWSAFHGTLPAVTDGVLNAAKEAVALGIAMLGIMAFWSGILKIGENSGLIEAMTKKMKPILRFLFPQMPENHPAARYMSTNMIANMLGLGWAATPAGLKAMEELKKLEQSRKKESIADTASDEMCTFLIINISSLQLIPINMIAYRSQYGSADPSAIVGPTLLATTISTLVGVLFVKFVQKKHQFMKGMVDKNKVFY